MGTVSKIYPHRVTRICTNCGSENVSHEPTPFGDEDGHLFVSVYRCRDCGLVDVPDFGEAA